MYGAANRLALEQGGRVVTIENHLRRSGLPPEGIEDQYASCDLIITSRFHGATLAMRHRVPFLAIDQIRGGGKVLNLLRPNGWPHVYEASDASEERVLSDARTLLREDSNRVLLETRERTIRKASLTLGHLTQVVHGPLRRLRGIITPSGKPG